MRRVLIPVVIVLAGVAALAGQGRQTGANDAPLTAVPMSQVKVTGGFWLEKMETNRTVTIPHIMQENEETGRVDNFRKADGLMPGDYVSRRYNDTDVYKIIEAASYSLISHPDPVLARQIDDLITLIAKAQQPDGYLEPARTIDPAKPATGLGTERWQYENTGSHELYNAGHLYEAAVANFQATGKRALFDVALKNANLVIDTFGKGKREDAPGHEVIEMALVKLYKATDDRKYLDEAKFFLDERGTDHHASLDYTDRSWLLYNDRAYRQDDIPVVQQTTAHGHAVRAMYLYNAMTDIATILHDPAYDKAVTSLWNDVYSTKAYLTGGLGVVGGTEAFADPYVLPNRTAYAETCAAVGGVLWNHRMFLKTGDAKYLDALEQTLYNGTLSGVSIQGDTFFYENHLESAGRDQRVAYPDVACCPANLSRLIAQMPGLIYSTKGNAIYVNLYVDSEADVKIGNATVHIKQTTNYPWDGKAMFEVTADKPVVFDLRLRVPAWMGPAGVFNSDLYTFVNLNRGTLMADDSSVPRARLDWAGNGEETSTPGFFSDNAISISAQAVARRTAVRASAILEMPVRRVVANAAVKDDAGRAAIQRGPIVYALEGVDNGGKALDLTLPLDASFTSNYRSDLLGGVTTVSTTLPANGDAPARTITAVPYFAWANRGRGEMIVWIPQMGE